MINREVRSRIAQETLSFLEAGGYENSHGKHVEIADALAQAKAGTVHYKAGALGQLVNRQGGHQSFATVAINPSRPGSRCVMNRHWRPRAA